MQCCNGTGRALTFGRIKRWRPHEFRDKITALFDFGWRLKTGVFLQLKYFEVGFFFFYFFRICHHEDKRSFKRLRLEEVSRNEEGLVDVCEGISLVHSEPPSVCL